MIDLVDEAEKALTQGRIDNFGRLLDVGWGLKRAVDGKVSNPVVDGYYDRAMAAGALGGKLLGAGGGDFLLIYVQKEAQPLVREALSELVEIPFRFESGGAKVMYYMPEIYTPEQKRNYK